MDGFNFKKNLISNLTFSFYYIYFYTNDSILKKAIITRLRLYCDDAANHSTKCKNMIQVV